MNKSECHELIKCGKVQATIWKTRFEGAKGPYEKLSVTLCSRYKDKDDLWKTNYSFNASEIGDAVLALSSAAELIRCYKLSQDEVAFEKLRHNLNKPRGEVDE